MNSVQTAEISAIMSWSAQDSEHSPQRGEQPSTESVDPDHSEPPTGSFEPLWRRKRSWPEKFRDAFRGVALGIWGQNSFLVHGLFTIAALVAAAVFRLSLVEWLVVGLCIVVVWTAEMFNSAFERLARAIRNDYDPQIRDALDIGSGAVLVAALGVALIGTILFLVHFLRVLGLPL
ncbi:MAG: diacylglycerol kinase [Thermoguttaceae bacterium]|nr:diacylglycerol kinase [Thermoguttaceae bacterium]MDW8078944.1 diacylglycerol kinase [Thermoguttaceae bacterium]